MGTQGGRVVKALDLRSNGSKILREFDSHPWVLVYITIYNYIN